MLFNSTDNLFFAVTLLHGEISFCPSLMEISSTLWHCFWGIGHIDYVILHERDHIAEHNHRERFYRLIQGGPDWERPSSVWMG